MIKVRIQGTPEDIMWFEKQIYKLDNMRVTTASECFSNMGTKRYFRKYMEIEKNKKSR